jgi:hypothetical protein
MYDTVRIEPVVADIAPGLSYGASASHEYIMYVVGLQRVLVETYNILMEQIHRYPSDRE